MKDKEVEKLIKQEEERQKSGITLIPSENHTSKDVREALGSVFTDKYSEGYPGRRYYGGNQFADEVENLARERAKKIFKAEHANVQPLSGSPMNQAVYMALLEVGDTVLAMDLSHGGHLTHGSPVSHMGKFYNFIRYKTNPKTGEISEEELMSLAKEHKPKIILCGHSSYPRNLDYAMFKRVADSVGAITMADVSHIGGLIAGGAMKNPFDYDFDIVTTTTHKTLRGPRGGMILCKSKFARDIDKSVIPGLQGGPHMNNIAGVAVALHEASQPEFKEYALKVIDNAKVLSDKLVGLGVKLITGGTENHLIVLDTIESFGVDGKVAEEVLDNVGIYVNKQIIPDDPLPAFKPSGIRIGTPAATTRGMGVGEMQQLARLIVEAIGSRGDETKLTSIRDEVSGLCEKYTLPR